jgi:hypothetical protein
MPQNEDLLCNKCRKEIREVGIFFSDRERDLDFCSEECYSE